MGREGRGGGGGRAPRLNLIKGWGRRRGRCQVAGVVGVRGGVCFRRGCLFLCFLGTRGSPAMTAGPRLGGGMHVRDGIEEGDV